MPIARHKPDTTSPVEKSLPTVEPKEYKSIVSDDTYQPLNSLITYVSGSPWNVNYYNQVATKHNDLRDHDVGQEGLYQQYSKTIGLEIRVTTPLMTSQEQDTAIVSVTGTALMQAFLTPNVGDLFVASAGDNHDALFRINNVERKNFNRDSVFQIEYDLLGYIDVDVERYQDLESKVIRTYYFHKDRLMDGNNPSVIAEDHQEILDLSDWKNEIINYYHKNFFVREYSTYMVPGQSGSVYDSFLVDYVLKLISTLECPDIRFVKRIPTENDPYLAQPQLWTALAERDLSTLADCNRVMGLVTTKGFDTNVMLASLRYTKINYLVYPVYADYSIFTEPKPLLKDATLVDLQKVPSGTSAMHSIIYDQYVDQNRSIPYLTPVLTNTAYVFSEDFYLNKSGLPILEALTIDYLSFRSINVKKLHSLIKSYRNWGRLEQFYYLPIVLTLIKVALTQ